MKFIFHILVILLLPGTTHAQQIQKIKPGQEAYDIRGTDEMGNEVILSDFTGKYVLLNFTHTFCGPCWVTYDMMNRVQEQYSTSLKVISFHEDKEIEKWKEFASRKNIDFRCTSIWDADNKEEISKIYQVEGYPTFVLISEEGKILKKWFGNEEDKFNKIIGKHLR